MPRKFYLIAHNTNRVPQAIRAIQRGANAIQPDLHYADSSRTFTVYHLNPIIVTPLEEYLEKLSLRLTNDPSLNLALIIFDLKPPYTYDLNILYELLHKYFSDAHPEIPIITAGNNYDALPFLSNINGLQRENNAIGIDETVTVDHVVQTFAPLGVHYAYATGSSVFSSLPHVPEIQKALKLRGSTTGLKMVYTWTVNAKEVMKAYLDLDPPIDGIMTDDVEDLIILLRNKGYAEKFELARRGDNPFK